MKYIISLTFLAFSLSIMAQEPIFKIEEIVSQKIKLFESTKETYYLKQAIDNVSNTRNLNINEYRKLYFSILNVIQKYRIVDFDRKDCPRGLRSIMIAFAPEDSIGRAKHEENERNYREIATACNLQSYLKRFEDSLLKFLKQSGHSIQSQAEIDIFFRLAKSSLLYPERLDFLREDFQKFLLKNNSQK